MAGYFADDFGGAKRAEELAALMNIIEQMEFDHEKVTIRTLRSNDSIFNRKLAWWLRDNLKTLVHRGFLVVIGKDTGHKGSASCIFMISHPRAQAEAAKQQHTVCVYCSSCGKKLVIEIASQEDWSVVLKAAPCDCSKVHAPQEALPLTQEDLESLVMEAIKKELTCEGPGRLQAIGMVLNWWKKKE